MLAVGDQPRLANNGFIGFIELMKASRTDIVTGRNEALAKIRVNVLS
jgi:hypothetical protein